MPLFKSHFRQVDFYYFIGSVFFNACNGGNFIRLRFFFSNIDYPLLDFRMINDRLI